MKLLSLESGFHLTKYKDAIKKTVIVFTSLEEG
jgi:hypothetical protein